jgi:superoxide reductase
MKELSSIFQSADWKKEKHVPVIDAPDKIKKGENAAVSVTVGKEITHPNTTEHHIAWIDVYFHAEGDKFPSNLGRFEFWAHGASTDGPNTSTVYTHPSVTLTFKTEKPGTIFAFSHCNVHGLWMNAHDLKTD